MRDRKPMLEWPAEDTQLTLPVFVPGDSFVVFSRAGTVYVYRVGLTGALLPVAGPTKREGGGD